MGIRKRTVSFRKFFLIFFKFVQSFFGLSASFKEKLVLNNVMIDIVYGKHV